jgi:guanine deaminase
VARLDLEDTQAPPILEPFTTWNTLESRIDY